MKDELKTLKDFRCEADKCCDRDNCNNPLIKYSSIKAEAVKWVKEDIEEYKNMFKDVLNGKQMNSPRMNLIKKWMKRLDITKEDLR